MTNKTGPKPKELQPFEKMGIEIGRGKTQQMVPPEEVFKLASIGMRTTEIADWFGVTEQALRYNFSDEISKGRHNLNMSIRRKQIEVALSGDRTLLIWLGKNLLGQSDNPTDSTGKEPLPWTDDIEKAITDNNITNNNNEKDD